MMGMASVLKLIQREEEIEAATSKEQAPAPSEETVAPQAQTPMPQEFADVFADASTPSTTSVANFPTPSTPSEPQEFGDIFRDSASSDTPPRSTPSDTSQNSITALQELLERAPKTEVAEGLTLQFATITLEGKKVALLSAQGAIDANTLQGFEKQLTDLESQGYCYQIVDFANLSYINSSGMGLMVKRADLLKGRGGMVIVRASSKIQELFNMLGLGEVIPFAPSLEDAFDVLPLPKETSASPVLQLVAEGE